MSYENFALFIFIADYFDLFSFGGNVISQVCCSNECNILCSTLYGKRKFLFYFLVLYIGDPIPYAAISIGCLLVLPL